MRIWPLFVLCLLARVLAASAEVDSPEDTLKAYFAALSKGDRAGANKLTAHFPKFGETEVAALTEQYIALHKTPGYPLPIGASKVMENCAVVMLFRPYVPGPAYLTKQSGAWLVLPKLTQFNRDYFEFKEPLLAQFRQLEAWSREQGLGSAPPEIQAFADVTMKDPSKFLKLLDGGLDPNSRSRDKFNEPLLWRAVRLNAIDAVRLLLERGANVDERSAGFQKTALFQAAYDGSIEVAELLLDSGANPNALDMHENNPLREAIIAKRISIVRLLLQRGSNPAQVNKDGESMRDIAVKVGTPGIQAIVAATNEPHNYTPSQLVGQWRHVDAVRKLSTTLIFRGDGTYSGGVAVRGKADGSFSGKWVLKDTTLYYEYTSSSDKRIPAGTKDQDQITELTRDRYTIENTLGLRETYVRIE